MQYGQSSGSGTAISGAQAREQTALEAHINALRSLHEELGGAVQRARNFADRLLGSEPENIAGKTEGPKAPGEPPLLMQIDMALQTAKELTQKVHYHLNRLERL